MDLGDHPEEAAQPPPQRVVVPKSMTGPAGPMPFASYTRPKLLFVPKYPKWAWPTFFTA